MRRRATTYAALLLAVCATACSGRQSGPAPPVTPEGSLHAGARAGTGPAVQVLPPISDVGVLPGPADQAQQVVEMRFEPAAPGAPAQLESRAAGTWSTVAAAAQDDSGVATFILDEVPPAGVPLRGRSRTAAGQVVVRQVADADRAPWRLRFDEQFDGSALDRAVWNYRQRGEIAPDRGRGHAASSPEAVRVGGGVAALSSRADPGRVGYFLNGHISTERSYLFRRGVVSARIRFHRTRGQHGAFWIQAPGAEHPRVDRGPDENGAEIDVAEFYGEGYPHGGLSHFVHFLKGHGNRDWAKVGGLLDADELRLPEGETWWNRYHVFTVEWTRDAYIFRIDGRETYRTGRGLSDRTQFLVLSMLNSDWELPDLDRSTLPQSMLVDWVRVWQR
jgi:hypothetical protein